MTREEAEVLVQKAIQEVNSLRDSDSQIPTGGDIPLTGPGGTLDSMEVVNLLSFLEASMPGALNGKTLITPEILSGADAGLKSSETLAGHILKICTDAAN